MRWTMISSSRTASRSSLFISTAKSGSTKKVSPDTERSCTTPGSWATAAARTGTTKRLLRSVT